MLRYLSQVLFAQSAPPTLNLKIFKFTSTTPLPRTMNRTTAVAAIFPTIISSPITAVLSSYSPPRVWIFGGAATALEPSVTAYSYVTATASFTYYGTVSKQWTNTLVKAASQWYNATTGYQQYYLFDSGSPHPNVVHVSAILQV